MQEAGEKFKLLVISEVMEISQIPMMLPYVDILQVGARNMQNFNLLRELGKVRKPVLLEARNRGDIGRTAALGGIHHGGNEGITMSSCASVAFAHSKRTRATRWIFRQFRLLISSRIYR